MKKSKSPQKIVWQFTNKTKLTSSQFIDYFERKIFRTIRKYNMLSKNRTIKIKNQKNINTDVLKYVLEKKFSVVFSPKGFSSENLSHIAEKTFENVLKGNFQKPHPSPLCRLSDAEIALYAKLKKIKGKKRKQNKKICSLFKKFLNKNPDLEHNIVNAAWQL